MSNKQNQVTQILKLLQVNCIHNNETVDIQHYVDLIDSVYVKPVEEENTVQINIENLKCDCFEEILKMNTSCLDSDGLNRYLTLIELASATEAGNKKAIESIINKNKVRRNK